MLRITASRGHQAAVHYFQDALSRQDYYSENSRVMGQWHGKAASMLGLSKEVSKESFEKLVQNRHPLTGEKITPRDAAERRAGYDFTFNAPKSLSVVEAITGDEAIREAHRAAVEEAMREVEADMQTQAGQGKNKRFEKTGNLLYAAFEHDVTRPVVHATEKGTAFIPDPHLHTHCYVINATWNDRNNRFQAVEIGNIKKNGSYYEAIYHNHLAARLQEAGYQVERSKGGGFEIKGISRETINKYSNRTQEIEKLAKEKGLSWVEDKAELGAKTRQKKNRSVSESQMHQNWSERLTLQERFSIHSAKGAKEAASGLASEKKNDGGIEPKDAIDLALQHFMERKSAVTEKQVLAYALKLGIDRFKAEDVKAELNARKGKEVITGEKNSDLYLTTREALIAEDRMKTFVVSTRARFAGLNPNYVPGKDDLNTGQKNAIQHVLTSKDQVILLSGSAGVGKTTLMKEVKAGIEGNGKSLFAFAPSADASRGVLQEKGFEGADTISRLLSDKELQSRMKDQVILVDEAGMVGNQTMNGIFDVAREQNARVILSGDWKQHTAVEAGDALRLLEHDTKVPVARVNEIVRQKEKLGYRDAVQALAEGDTAKGFEKLEEMDSIVEIEDQQERHERIAQDYVESIKAPKIRERDGSYRSRTAIVVSPTHGEGQAITDAIRGKLREEGMIAEEERSFEVQRNLSFTEAEKRDHQNYEPGMVVRFHRKMKDYERESTYEIVGISDQNKVMIQAKGKEEITPLPLDRARQFQVYLKSEIGVSEGDVLRVTGNGKTLEGKPLNNGESQKVKGFTKEGNIQLESGQTLPAGYGHFTLGYYRTSHASQGKDADDVLIAQSSASFGASNEKQFYVSASRGVERCIVYTDDKDALQRAVQKEADRMSAGEIASVARERSAWITARNIRMEYYENLESEPKGQVYEQPDSLTLGQEFTVQADNRGFEPDL